MKRSPPHVVNEDQVKPVDHREGSHWGGTYKPLTPALDARPGRLGVNLSRIPPGRSACPFHSHALDDEVFYVLSGRGVFRHADSIQEIRAGDCVSCPAGTGQAHQIANPFEEDLVYLAIGANSLNEVCTYPDSGKVLVRALKKVGHLQEADYFAGEADKPRLLSMAERVGFSGVPQTAPVPPIPVIPAYVPPPRPKRARSAGERPGAPKAKVKAKAGPKSKT